MFLLLLFHYYYIFCGPGSSVGIATDYGLDGPGSNPGGDETFRPSRSALGPTQHPVKWILGFLGGKVRPGRAADHSPPSSAAVMEEYSYNSTHPPGHTGLVTGSLYLYLLVHILLGYFKRNWKSSTNITIVSQARYVNQYLNLKIKVLKCCANIYFNYSIWQ